MIKWAVKKFSMIILKRKIWAMRVKSPTWYGDVRYNEALNDCIKLIEEMQYD